VSAGGSSTHTFFDNWCGPGYGDRLRLATWLNRVREAGARLRLATRVEGKDQFV
jgi:hypothetical protein